MDEPTIVLLRQQVHGIPQARYADALGERLPDCEVAVAGTPSEERELLRDAEIATGIELSGEALDWADRLELFACVYAGTGHLDLDAFTARDVSVTNAAGVHSHNIAEYVTGAMIMMARRFPEAIDRQRRREWRSFQSRELHGATVAVVGLGAIGTTVVDRLQAFGMETVGVRYSPGKGGPTDEVVGFDAIHEAVADAAYVVLACPLTETTAGLIDADVFRTMGPETILVNIARGPVVDTDALLDALQTNAVGGAVLDVTDPEPLPADHPLWGMGNVVITPHNAGHTPAYFDRCADILAENVDRLADGEALRNEVV